LKSKFKPTYKHRDSMGRPIRGKMPPAYVPRSVKVPAMNESQPNVAEFTVSELSAALKRTVEDNFGYVRVRGEISGYKGPHGSGHVYFALKDQTAKIDGVIWKGVFGRMRIKPEEGMEVIVTGKLTTYPT